MIALHGIVHDEAIRSRRHAFRCAAGLVVVALVVGSATVFAAEDDAARPPNSVFIMADENDYPCSALTWFTAEMAEFMQ